MSKYLNPVEASIQAFGGIRAMARAIGRDPASVHRWKKRGLIPSDMQEKVLEAADEAGHYLTPDHIVHGTTDCDYS